MGLNSFGTFGRIAVDGIGLHDRATRRAAGRARRRTAPVLAEGPAREPAPPRGRPRRSPPTTSPPSPRRARGRPSNARSPSPRRASCSRTSPACPASSTSPRCATPSTRSAATPDPSTRRIPVDLVIDHSVIVDVARRPDACAINARARVRAQRRALPVPALGPAGILGLPRRAARHRHLPPGQPRAAEPGRLRATRPAPPTPTRSSEPTPTRRW